MNPTRTALIYGTAEPPLPPRRLAAGRLSADLEGGNLRTIRLDGVEAIRAIAFLVRGPGWETFEPVIEDLAVTEDADGFRVSYRAIVRDGESRLDYAARIAGDAAGRLEFDCDITPETDFVTCRTGFVVLHPAGVAARPVRIEHADGSIVAGRFPDLIDPVQPMLDLRALTHEVASGRAVTCRMDGDVFEMEDQRNWSDASFKTYVRPLSRPWPYTLPAGEPATQSVTLRPEGEAPPPAVARAAEGPIALTAGPAVGTMPEIGLGCTPEEARVALPHAAELARAAIPVLVCRFDPGQGHGVEELRACRDLAAACGSAVELQIVVQRVTDFAEELQEAAALLQAAGLAPRAVAVSPAADLKSTTPGQPWPETAPLEALYAAARAAFPGIALAGGTFAYFTELNRKRPPAGLLDAVTFATCPLVHAADDRSVMESLAALPAIARSARAIAGATPFVVGPSAIGMRDNPYGPAPLPNPTNRRLVMGGADPRQRGLFNAAWTLGYIARFGLGGAARIALSAPAGPFGILDVQGELPVFPVLAGCAALRGAVLHAVSGGPEEALAALLAVRPGHRELWLANLTPERQDIVLPAELRAGTQHLMDAETLAAAPPDLTTARPAPPGGRVKLDAYAVLRCLAGG